MAWSWLPISKEVALYTIYSGFQKCMRRFGSEDGASLVEHALLTAAVTIGVIAAVENFGKELSEQFLDIAVSI